MTPPHIQILLASTRERRRGEAFAHWFAALAAARSDLTSELLDLREWDLPTYRSATPPMRGGYEHERVREWAAKIAAGDGYVIVTPEYNHGYPAPLKNALDSIYAEWNRKAIGFVSYGGSGGGVRAVEQLRQVAVELELASVRPQIVIPRAYQALDDAGQPKDPRHGETATALLDELVWWSSALREARGRT